MFLIPFIYKKNKGLYDIHIFHIFLNKGNTFLTNENDLVDEFLNENELYYNKKTIKDDYCYIQIDTEKTNISSFYTYNENSDVECWRRFVCIGENDNLHIDSTNPEFIQPVLKTIKSFS
jgi:hypothetical protein